MLTEENLRKLAPFPLAKGPGARAEATWQERRQQPGVVPVLLGDPESTAKVLQDCTQYPPDPAAIAAQGLAVDVKAWMAERLAERPDYKDVETPWDGIKRGIPPFMPSLDLRGQPHPEVYFGLIPVAQSYFGAHGGEAASEWALSGRRRACGVLPLLAAASWCGDHQNRGHRHRGAG
jgi:hypothetical protein